MQAPPPTGCTGKAPPPSPPPCDGGTDVTLNEGPVALLSGSPTPAAPHPIAKTKAAPPHNAAAVLPLRFVTTANCSFSSWDAHGDTERYGQALNKRTENDFSQA
jgi:hypothetical protein